MATKSSSSTEIRTAQQRWKQMSTQWGLPVDQDKLPFSVTINKSREEIELILRDSLNFPLFFDNLEKIEKTDELSSVWHFKSPDSDAVTLSIDMHLGTDEISEAMIWTAKDVAGFNYILAMTFEEAPAGRGTIVRMQVTHVDKSGSMANVIEKIFGKDPEKSARINLQRFKAFCETGHVPTTQGQPSGRDEDLETELKH